MSNLGPNAINTTYPGLLQVDGGVSDILKPVTDGLGNPTGLSLSSTGVSITGVVSANAQNIVGGTAGSVVYQAGVGSTGFVVPGTSGQFLQSNGTNAPTWVTFNAGSIGALPLTGGTLTGQLSLSNYTIANVGNPVNAYDAANKSYVDSKASGLNVKSSCVVATTANITLSGTQTIDGVAVTAGQRVLVKNQSTQSQNGIYVVSASSWSRSSDASTWADLIGATVFITSGSTQAASTWTCNATSGGTIGVTAVVFVQFSASQSYTASNGITLTGNNFTLTSPVPQSLGGTGSTSIGAGIVYSDGTSLTPATGAQIASSIGTATVVNSTNSTNSTYANNLTGGTVGDLLYQSASGSTSKLNIASAGFILTSTGTGPEWGLTAPYAARLQYGTTGSIPYQTGSSQTSFIPGGSNGQVLTYDATTNTPYWATSTSGGGLVGEYVAAGRNSGYTNSGNVGGVLIGGGTTQQPNGMWFQNDGQANWLFARVSKAYNPSEFIVYNQAAQGYARKTSTYVITAASGQYFPTDSFFVGKRLTFGNHIYTIQSLNSTTITTTTPILDALNVYEAWSICYTSGSGQCSVSGGIMTYVYGDPFIDPGWEDFNLYIDGSSTPTPVSGYVAQRQYTVSGVSNGTHNYVWTVNINNQLSTYRCHGLNNGGLEENVNLYSIAGDTKLGRYFALRTGGTGTPLDSNLGKRPLLIGAELYQDHGFGNQSFNDAIGIYPIAFNHGPVDQNYYPHLCLGGTHYVDSSNNIKSRDLLRIYNNYDYNGTDQPNRFVITPTGNSQGGNIAELSVDGNDSNIGIGFKLKGSGNVRITNGNNNLIIGGTLANSSGQTNALVMYESVASNINNINGGALYVNAGALWYIGRSGTVTKLANA